ncbi:MAG TPA: hypothetical protein VI670_01770 [Thermoanaerobaculia bacterium]
MRARWLIAVAAGVLLASSGTTSPVPRGTLSITKQRESDNIGVSDRVKITFTVHGTTRRVLLQISNTDPHVARLDGGNKQTIRTSGGEPNSVSVTARGLRQGEFDVTAEFADERDRQLADVHEGPPVVTPRNPADEVIARDFAPVLTRIADRVDQQAQRLRVRDGQVRVNDVLRIVDRAEEELRNALPQDELEPFRDAVARFFDRIRGDLRAASTDARLASGIVFVAMTRQQLVDEATAKSRLGETSGFLRKTGEIKDPRVTICISTTPDNGADVTLRPRSFRRGSKVNSASWMTLYVGIYAYSLEKRGFLPTTGEIDLLQNRHDGLVLPLRRQEGDAQAAKFEDDATRCKSR